MQRAAFWLALLIGLPVTTAVAQNDPGDIRAFAALRASSIGSLTPLLTPAMESRRLNGAQFGIRYGLRFENGINWSGYAASGVFNAGLQSSVTMTAGVLDAGCQGCSPALMLGAGGDMRVAEAANVIGDASQLTIVVSGDLGYSQLKPGDEYALTIAVGAPVTLAIGAGGTQGGMRIAPFFTPTFGVGQTSTPCMNTVDTCDKSGVRWLLGGGIGFWNPTSNISASIGINHVVLNGARPVYGVNVVLGGAQ